jgi:hypothetical protein
MTRLFRSLAILLFATASLTFGANVATASSEAAPPMHVGIVLDSSGSMDENDPDRLSLLGAMLFADLAQPDDRLGLYTMDRYDQTLLAMDRAEDRKSTIKEKVRALGYDTPTDCKGPLEKAAEALEGARQSNDDAEQFVVFLSDGICPSAKEAGGLGPLEPILDRLDREGVRVFSISLTSGGASDEVEAILEGMASATGGEHFKANEASDLPGRFADILGRIVGSQAQSGSISGGELDVDLDGHVRDVSVVVSGADEPVALSEATSPDGNTRSLPTGSSSTFSEQDGDVYAASGDNGADQHYAAVKIADPPAGSWTLRVDGPSELQSTVIQNYALDPVLEHASSGSVRPGDEATLRAWLRDRDGDRIEDEAFLDKVTFDLQIEAPDGDTETVDMHAGGGGRYTAEPRLDGEGTYTFRARASMKEGPLDKRSDSVSVRTRPFELDIEREEPIDLGQVKAGTTTDPVTVDFGAGKVGGKAEISLEAKGLGPVKVEPAQASIDSSSTSVDVAFQIQRIHGGGTVEGSLQVADPTGESLDIPVRGEVVALSFWERYRNYIQTFLIGLAALLLLIFLVYGFISPYDFPGQLRLNWGEDVDRLDKNELVISELNGTGSGFYQNGTLQVGGRGSPLSVGTELCELEATGQNQVTLRAADGVELVRVNKFDTDKEQEVEGGETIMSHSQVYRVGSLYIRIR